MPLFREDNRLKEDWRVLQIADPSDFALYRQRETLRIKGVIYPYVVSADARVAAQLCTASELIKKRNFITKHGSFTECDIGGHAEMAPLNKISEDLHTYLDKAVGTRSMSSFRIGSNYPNVPHTHGTTLSMSINKQGTLCFNEQGAPYFIPPDHVLICEDIWHQASQDTTDEDPRANFVVMRI